MRRKAASAARQTTVWEDLGIGAPPCLCLALTVAWVLVEHATGTLFIWASRSWPGNGFGPALVPPFSTPR
jgi:hypothetical protein